MSQEQGENNSATSSLIPQIGLDPSLGVLLQSSRSDYGSIASVNTSFRSVVRSEDIYQLRRQAGIVEHWVYMSCKLLEWKAFDPLQRRWMRLPRMPEDICFMLCDKESLAVGTQLLVFGRGELSQLIYKYSLSTNSWTSGMSLINERWLFASASLGEIAILAGGCDSTGNVLDSAELYKSVEGTWHSLPRMNTPTKLCSGVFMDGKFYAIGGTTGNGEAITSGEVYDLNSNTWAQIPEMFPANMRGTDDAPVALKAPPLVAVVKNELYAAYWEVRELWKYEKQNNVWNRIGNLPDKALSMNGWGMAFRGCGNILVVISGGVDENGREVVEINGWEPTEGAAPVWTLLGRMASENFVYNCAVMGC